ncbi:MAG: CBS domain-containing protein [Chloroflexi bacterium]|nr:MAG: CBS domain-containing protein [Chloroflexota bacterium]
MRVQRRTPIAEAARLLREEKTRCLAVMDGDALVGIFTDRDMAEKCFSAAVSGETEVGLVMNSPVISVAPDSSMREALQLLDRERMRHLPLVEADGTLRAIIRARDILSYMAEAMPEAILNQPLAPLSPWTREGA